MTLIHIVILALAATPSETRLVISSTAGHNLGTTVDISGSSIVCGSQGDDQYGAYSGSTSVFVDLALQQTVYGYFPQAGDLCGGAISIDGDRMAMGLPAKDYQAGMVTVVNRSSGVWTLVTSGRVYSEEELAYDRFGQTVSLRGDWMAVGAPLRSSSAGAVFMFKWDGSAWVWKKTLTPSVSENAGYSRSLSLTDGWLVVGSYSRDYLATDDGVAYVYRFNTATSNWVLDQTLFAADATDFLRFGYSVATDGQTIVVGAPSSDATAAGAYVFTYNGSDWVQDWKLTASDGAYDDRFGWSVGVDGSIIAVGAPQDDGTYVDEGSAHVFVDGVFRYKLSTSPDTGDRFGESIAVESSTVAVGSPFDDMGGTDAGVVCVFTIPPEATSIGFTTQPSSIQTTGVVTPAVTIYDQYGQVFTTPVAVTVSLANNPTGASLIGTTTVTTSGGVASYSLGVSLAGTGYTLQAFASSLTATSTAFNVTSPADPATKFVILNPADGTVDNPITVTVQAQTATGSVVATYQTDVTLVASGSATDGLVNIVNGQGTIQISDTVVETANLTLQDTQSSGLSVSSTQNVAFGVGNAAKLMFGEQPSGVEEDTAIVPPIEISITDQFGNLRSDTGITISVALMANAVGAVSYGTVSVATSGGDATFANVLVDKAGTFTMTATSAGLVGITSTPFTVTTASVIPDPDDPEPPSKHCGGGSEASCLGLLLPIAMVLVARRR